MQIKNFSVILILFKFVVNSDGFLLHGSAGPLTARLGGAVLLPCFVDRPLPLEELEVDWRRTDSDTIVHLFQGGQSRPESQGDAYRGRVHFFSQEIPKGNFSLLLDGVRTADVGVYKCVVYTEQEQRETWVEIQEVERLVVTGADEPVYAHAGEDVTLSCSVDTHVNVTELQVEWRKTDDDGDILVLLFTDGENRPESQDGRYSGRAEFFTEENRKGNFSMKLRSVRMEDKGEFRCEVHSDTDSASTTARIAALGYSSLHWLILWLCITVTPVVLLTGALSVRHLIKEDKSKQALLSHCSHVTVPQIMVSAAFILWGVTEGSTEEAVTCTAISLLYILVLFNMAPYRKSFTGSSSGQSGIGDDVVKEPESTAFITKPFRFMKDLLGQKHSSKLACSQGERDQHLQQMYSDPTRDQDLGECSTVMQPTEAAVQFDMSDLQLKEDPEVVRRG
ncbi:butyrophilin subfamily 2 member A2-like [Brienomyrus brachyistius]|uniref:butyrophilin subfamily 2 member A2-like n=1 Tax=Brienomyrus brachyistius TaxID=42636 RepID=UPI0020B271CA|nr:butyrophilin subfamily 2 member A2-like [Brienomyrus brachyistius]